MATVLETILRVIVDSASGQRALRSLGNEMGKVDTENKKTEKSTRALSSAQKDQTTTTDRQARNLRGLTQAMQTFAAGSERSRKASAGLAEAQAREELATKRVARAHAELASSQARSEAVTKKATSTDHDRARAAASVAESIYRLARAEDDLTVRHRTVITRQREVTESSHSMERAFDLLGSKSHVLSQKLRDLHTLLGLFKWPAFAAAAFQAVGAVTALAAGFVALLPPIGRAISSIASLVGPLTRAGGALLSLVGPLTSVTSLAAGLPAAFLAAAQAAGSLVLAFSGVSKALKDMVLQQQQTGTAAAASALQQRSAANTVVTSQRALVASHQAVQDALYNVTQAQKDLTQARQDAIRTLEDQRSAEAHGVLAVKEAQVALIEARRHLADLQKQGASPTNLDYRSAVLQVQEAELNLGDARRSNKRNQEDLTKAEQKGVSQSDQVIQAQRQLRDAYRSVADAIQGVKDAQLSLAEAQNQMASGTTSAQNLATAMAKLSPPAQAFVKALSGMYPLLQKLKATAASGIFPPLLAQLDRVRGMFPLVNRAVGETSRVIGQLGGQLLKMVTSPAWKSDFGQVFHDNVKPIHQVGEALLNVLDALRNVTVVAQPLVEWIAKLVKGWSETAKAAAQAGRDSGRLAAFLERAKEIATTLGHTVRNLWDIVVGFFRAGSATGRTMLDRLEQLTRKWSEWVNSIGTQNRLRDWFESARQSASTVGHILANLGRVLVSFFSAGSSTGDKMLDTLSKITDKWVEFMRSAKTQNALAAWFEKARHDGSLLLDVLGHLGRGLLNIFRASSSTGETLWKEIDKIAKRFEEWTKSTEGENKLKKWFDDALPTIHQIVGLFGDILGFLGSIGVDSEKGLAPLIKSIRENLLPGLETLIRYLGQMLQDAGAKVWDSFTKLLGNIADLLARSASVLPTILRVLGLLVQGLTALTEIPFLGKTISLIIGLLAAAKGLSLLGKFTGIDRLIAAFRARDVTTGLAGFVAGLRGIKPAAEDATGAVVGFASTAGAALRNFFTKGGLAKGLLRGGGAALGIGGVIAGTQTKGGGGLAEGAIGGGIAGASIGSFFGPEGTVIGGVIGTVAGGLAHLFGTMHSGVPTIREFEQSISGLVAAVRQGRGGQKVTGTIAGTLPSIDSGGSFGPPQGLTVTVTKTQALLNNLQATLDKDPDKFGQAVANTLTNTVIPAMAKGEITQEDWNTALKIGDDLQINLNKSLKQYQTEHLLTAAAVTKTTGAQGDWATAIANTIGATTQQRRDLGEAAQAAQSFGFGIGDVGDALRKAGIPLRDWTNDSRGAKNELENLKDFLNLEFKNAIRGAGRGIEAYSRITGESMDQVRSDIHAAFLGGQDDVRKLTAGMIANVQSFQQQLAGQFDVADQAIDQFTGTAVVSPEKIQAALDKQAKGLEDYGDNWKKVTDLAGGKYKDFIDHLRSLGAQGEGIVASLAGANQEQFDKIASTYEKTQGKSRSLAQQITGPLVDAFHHLINQIRKTANLPPIPWDKIIAQRKAHQAAIKAWGEMVQTLKEQQKKNPLPEPIFKVLIDRKLVGTQVQGAVEEVKNKLLIRSPSKVFSALGLLTGQGFIDGVSAALIKIKPVMDDLKSKMFESLDQIKGKFDDTVSGINTVWSRLKDVVAGPAEYIVNTVLSKVIGSFNTVLSYLGKDPLTVPKFAGGGVVPKGLSQKARRNAFGGMIPGTGDTDTVPALLTPGEFVIRKKSAERIGYGNLQRLNRYNQGGSVGSSDTGLAPGNGDTTGSAEVAAAGGAAAFLGREFDAIKDGLHSDVPYMQMLAGLAVKTMGEMKTWAGKQDVLGAGIPAGAGPFFVFPVEKPYSYGDSFGADRFVGGYHPHAGVDIMTNNPYLHQKVFAPFAGRVVADPNSLGGNAIKLYGAEGYIYGAHLSRYGKMGPVRTGEVIGYTGSSGDASVGGEHLHIQWKPNVMPQHPWRSGYGYTVIDGYIDPYPYLKAVEAAQARVGGSPRGGGAGPGSVPSGGVEAWLGEAALLRGETDIAGWIRRMKPIAYAESRYGPTEFNPTPVASGQHAAGLMQMIGTTYSAFRKFGTAAVSTYTRPPDTSPIFDPVLNAFSALGLIKSGTWHYPSDPGGPPFAQGGLVRPWNPGYGFDMPRMTMPRSTSLGTRPGTAGNASHPLGDPRGGEAPIELKIELDGRTIHESATTYERRARVVLAGRR